MRPNRRFYIICRNERGGWFTEAVYKALNDFPNITIHAASMLSLWTVDFPDHREIDAFFGKLHEYVVAQNDKHNADFDYSSNELRAV